MAQNQYPPCKVEEDDVVRKTADQRLYSHPYPSKDEYILVPKMVAEPSSYQDEDTAGERVCCQKPGQLSVACCTKYAVLPRPPTEKS